jgi:hypothetical protein
MGNMIRAQALGLSLATLGVLAVASFSLAGQPTAEGSPTPRKDDLQINYNVPGGRLECHVWRENSGRVSGNSIGWEYQVAAKYIGSDAVKEIRTAWVGKASLRNSASISVGIGNPSHAGGGSSVI